MALQGDQRNVDKLEESLEKYIRKNVAKKLNLEKAILFGSFARNKQNDYSDLDIALISPKYKDCDYLIEAAKAMELFEKFDCRVEPHLLTPEEMENQEDSFIKEILQTGRVIYSSSQISRR